MRSMIARVRDGGWVGRWLWLSKGSLRVLVMEPLAS